MPSSAIRRFAYDRAHRRLDILFVTGRSYSYFDVPEEIAAGLEQAPSRGRYFNAAIRDRFRFVRRE